MAHQDPECERGERCEVCPGEEEDLGECQAERWDLESRLPRILLVHLSTLVFGGFVRGWFYTAGG